MQVLFGLSAFRLSAGDIAAYGVLPLPHGGIRLSRLISDLRFGGRSSRRPVRHCARIFAGLCTAVVILDCRREGICTLSFIIINHKLRVTAGRLCLRVCAFAAVCGISSVRGFFIYRRAARISPEMRNFAGNVFCREAHLRTALPSSAEKIFPAGALSGEGVFPTDFPFGSRGAKMRSSKLQKTTHFASLRENLFISRNFLLTNGTVCRIINSSVCRNR